MKNAPTCTRKVLDSLTADAAITVSRTFIVPATVSACLARLEAMSDIYARLNSDEVDALNYQIDWLGMCESEKAAR